MSPSDQLDDLKILVFDVDGVFTDNGLYFAESGNPVKKFNVKDGAGLKFAAYAGYKVGLISGHNSQATVARANQLGVDFCYVGVKDKIPVWDAVLQEFGMTPHEALYMGDDLMDLPLLRRAGFAVTVPEASDDVLAAADFVTTKCGGDGAVREVIDHLLKKTGKYDEVLARYR